MGFLKKMTSAGDWNAVTPFVFAVITAKTKNQIH
jgi:hypothetical protein